MQGRGEPQGGEPRPALRRGEPRSARPRSGGGRGRRAAVGAQRTEARGQPAPRSYICNLLECQGYRVYKGKLTPALLSGGRASPLRATHRISKCTPSVYIQTFNNLH